MDGQQASDDQLASATADTLSGDGEPPIREGNLRHLRAELIRDREVHLSNPTIALLKELCADARQRGVKPERLIVMLKDEIRAATPNDEFRRRELVDETVTRCIRLFFADVRTS